MTSVTALNDTLLSEQLALSRRCGTRNQGGRSSLSITDTSHSHRSILVVTHPCPILKRKQRTGICYLDRIWQVCLTFKPFSRESWLWDPPQPRTPPGAAGLAARRGHSSALVTDWEEPSAGIQLNSLLYFKCFRNLKNTLSNAIIKLSVNLCNKIHQQRRWVI